MGSLVLGAASRLGVELLAQLPDAVGLTHEQLSVTDLAGLDRALQEHSADTVFNCAAFDAVDGAESQQAAAYQVNAQGAFNVAIATARRGARLVHFSTNYVFDGKLERPYVESDDATALSVYGKSKLEGERLVSMTMPGALVLRTCALFGGRADTSRWSFPERILEQARRGERIRVVSDQTVNPTYRPDLAATAIALAAGNLTGVVHAVAAGCCAWDELARAVLAASGVEATVEGITSSELAAPALRPANGCMESTRVAALRPWRDALRDWAARRAAIGPHNP